MAKLYYKLGKKFFPIVIFLIIGVIVSLSTFAYPTYQANSDLVIAGPYDVATSGTGNWGCNTGCLSGGFREFITIGQPYRIRQSGTINQVRIYNYTTTGLTGFYLKIWRKDGATYDLVGTSNNIVSDLTDGTFTTVTLSSPITGVQEGDYYGYRIETSTGVFSFFARTGVSGVSTYLGAVNETVTPPDYDWESKTAIAGAVLPIELYMTAPQSVFIGDSIIAGHPAHYSFVETTATTNINSTIEKQFSTLTGYTYQNMGIGSQNTTNIASRFTADVINLKPKIAILEGGVNDIAQSATKSTFLANWTSMLDAAQASNYITTIVVMKILPWTNGTLSQMQTRDDWNASLATLAASYSKAIVVDASTYVGEFRSGGDPGNLWNIQAAYNQDGVHFNSAGHGQIALAIADALPKPTATFDNDFSTWSSANNITVNYNLIQTGGHSNTNISQTGSSGIEYSTDGVAWSDATKGTGGDNLTGLTSTAAPGTDHVFIWDRVTDLPSIEDSTVYLRIRPNDGTSSALDWIVSDPFGLDTVAPSAVGVPSFGALTTSSIEIIKPTAVTENGSGLYEWQARKGGVTELGYTANATGSVTDSGLSTNTQYTYDVQFKDNLNQESTYGTQASAYSAIETPTGLTFDTVDVDSLTVSATGTLTNLGTASSGIYFTETSSNSGGTDSNWQQTTSYQDSGLSENTQYGYQVKARNGDGVETTDSAISLQYTLVDTPTNLVSSPSATSNTVTVDEFPNDSSGQSGYLFTRAGGGDSGWIQTNTWQDSNLACDTSYTYSVKYRNGDGVETSEIELVTSTASCATGGGSSFSPGWSSAPLPPNNGFGVLINSGSITTSDRLINLNFNVGPDIKKIAISLSGDFKDASLEDYIANKKIDLCSKFGGLIKASTCPDGEYTVYVKFYTQYGIASDVVSTKVYLLSSPERNTIAPVPPSPENKPEETVTSSPINLVSALFTKPLFYGLFSPDVTRLQTLLKTKPEIYPEGLVTGYFGRLTRAAVEKFQLTYKVVSSNQDAGFGFVGPKTRAKLNEIFGK